MSDEDPIARVARALCVADGQDPEAEITVGTDVVDEGDDGERYHEVTAPAWTTYVGHVQRFIARATAGQL